MNLHSSTYIQDIRTRVVKTTIVGWSGVSPLSATKHRCDNILSVITI